MFGTVIDSGIATVEGWFKAAENYVVPSGTPPISSVSVDNSAANTLPSSQAIAANTATPAETSVTQYLILAGALFLLWKVVRHAH